MEVVSIPLTHVFTRKGARPIVDSTVKGLVDSIREVGLINPLRVRPARLFVMGIEDDAFEVIAGCHRLAALRKLGCDVAECVIVNDDALHLELAEIDENLMRAELSPADRAAQTIRRKEIYLELHPDTAAGKAGASSRWNATDKLSAASFTSATSDAIGKAERSVRRDAERGEKISDQALSLVRGTTIDKGTELDRLKKVPKDKQVEWVERRLKQPELADDPLDDALASEKQVAALMKAWNRAGPDARQEFLLRIDGPVFDRGAAA